MKKYKYTYEVCPHCNEEVKLDAVFKLQLCPGCKELIKPCSLCDMDKVNCNKCKLDKK